MQRLLKSAKFWMAVLGVVNSVVSYYLHIPTEVWGAVDTLFLAVIVSICVEDTASKSNPSK